MKDVMSEKLFLVKDESGRGIAVTLPLFEIQEHWDLDFKNRPDDEWEDSLGAWLVSAEVGETFTNHEDQVTFTRTD